MPLMFRLLKRSVVEGVKGVFSHGLMSLASAGTVAISLLVLSLFLVLAANLAYVADLLEEQVEVVAYTHQEFDHQWEDLLLEKISEVPGVAAVNFVSEDEALDRLYEQFGSQADLLEGVEEDNPLRASVEIAVEEPEHIENIVQETQQLDSVEDVVYQREVVQRLYSLTEALRTGGIVLVFLLGLATFLLISNTVRLTIYARREQIEIMKLVGASPGFIWGPLVIEGIVLGFLGAVLAGGITAWGYVDVVQAVDSSLPFIPVIRPQPFLQNLLQFLVTVGAVLGMLSSCFSVWRYARL